MTIVSKISKQYQYFFLLLIILLLVKLVLLFFFQIALGGDETYEIIFLLHNFVKGTLVVEHVNYLITSYTHLSVILQAILLLPFYWFLPTNEFSVFLSTILTTTIIFSLTYFFLIKLFNLRVAIAFSLIYIFSPLGFTLISISTDAPPGAMIHLLFIIPFYYTFFSTSLSNREKSAFILALIPLATPYHFILWITAFIYFFLINYYNFKYSFFESIRKTGAYILKVTIVFFALMPFYGISALDIWGKFSKNLGRGFKMLPLENETLITRFINRIVDELIHLVQPFLGGVVEMPVTIKLIAFVSLISFLFLFFVKSIYSINSFIKEKKVQIEHFFLIYMILFFIAELLFQIKLYMWKTRLLNLETKYITLFLFSSFIIVASSFWDKKKLKIIFVIFIISSTVINFYFIYPFNKWNPKIYNLGGYDYKRNEVKFSTNCWPPYLDFIRDEIDNNIITIIEKSLMMGVKSREEKESNYPYDFLIYGYGVKLFYINKLGINWCDFFQNIESNQLCKNGYLLSREQFESYIASKLEFLNRKCTVKIWIPKNFQNGFKE